VVSQDLLLIERLIQYSRKTPLIEFTPSTGILYQPGFDAVLLPAALLLDPKFPRQEALYRLGALDCRLICFGAAGLLSACFLAGCEEYLKDPWSLEELAWRLRRLRKTTETRISFSWGTITNKSLELHGPAGSCTLCAQEQSILRLLAANRGEPVSREALYYGIWGKPSSGKSRVVDVHVSSLRRKFRRLSPESGDCIRSVRGVGYLMQPEQ
jgi:DNA-binding winged helix-turn-helix (wHTH) protein